MNQGAQDMAVTPVGQARGQTKLLTNDAEFAATRLRENKFDFLSSGLIQFAEPALGFKRSVLVRDPDAHAVQLIEK